jgi:hypothetical protein
VAKFHIKMKVQGFELEVDGTRDDLPVLRQALTQQFAGLMGPATDLADGDAAPRSVLGGATAAAAAASENGKRARRKARGATDAAGGDGKDVAVDWRHDTATYGSPLQKWKNSQKAIWLLYVGSSAANVPEMSNGTIAATFTKHFRQAGPIRKSNLARDLGLLKVGKNGTPPLVSEDSSKNPPVWYLTDAGVKEAQRLVVEALGQAQKA